MGACNSSDAPAVLSYTAKVILPDGRLREYPARSRASEATLSKAGEGERLILCNADHMEFGGHVSAVGPEEELQPGQIYFALPRSMLRRRLSPEDMAALAVRASAALVKSGCNVGIMAVPIQPVPSATQSVTRTSGDGRRRRKMSRGRSFSSDLISIPECE